MLGLAFKNTTRNPRRTILTAFAVFIATFIVLIAMGFMKTMVADMVDNTVLHLSGHIRIRRQDYATYEDVMPLQFYIEDSSDIAGALEGLDGVSHVERVSNVFASVYVGGALKNVQALAVDPEISNFTVGKGVSISQGRLMDSSVREVMVSQKFLIDMGLAVGDSVTLVSRTTNGGTNGASFRIVGVVDSMDASYTSAIVYMPIEWFSKLSHMEDGAIEIRVELDDEERVLEFVDIINDVLGNDYGYEKGYFEVESWHDSTIVYKFMKIYEAMFLVIEILFFFIASTLIVNTTMMSVMERKKEISTLSTLGFTRTRIRFLFMEESTFIALFGCVLAIGLGLVTFHFAGKYGIDITMFGADQVEGWGFSKYLYPTMEFGSMCMYALAMLAVAFVASCFATRHVKDIEIADALREEN